MGKKLQKYFLIVLLALQLILGSMGTAFAADDGEEPSYIGSPDIVMINGPVFDVTAGTMNEISVDLKNVSSYTAKSIVVQPVITDLADNPFKIEFDGDTNKQAIIPPRGEKTIRLLVDVDKTAVSKTYSVTLKYTYFNTKGEKASSQDTLYLKVQNTASKPNFQFKNFILDPEIFQAGESGTVGATLVNEGPIDMYDVEIVLEGLDPKSISINGVNSIVFKKIFAGTQESFKFSILSNSDIANGNYPLSYKMKYKDDQGKEYEYSQSFFINVGGTGGGKKPALEIRDMVEPSGTFGVNQNFNVTFNLVNTGDNPAKNIRVTAAGMGEASSAVVPKSTSVISIKELAPGATEALSFTFAATSNSRSENYPIEFVVEYEDGTSTEGTSNLVTFKQYAGANISNPDGDKKDDDKDDKVSKPKIIVSEYRSDPLIVMAGEEFDLTMIFTNTHPQKAAKNIKMYLTLQEEKSTTDEKTGNIFTPVDSSNTFYFDSIAPKGTANKKMRLYVVPDAQPKTYTLTVNFEYEDEEGNEFTATELLGINVKQPTKLDTGEIFLPESVEAGMPVSVSFELYNTGKVTLNNLMIKIEGDVDTQNKSTYLGNFQSGYSEYYDASFIPLTEGEIPVSIIISYDDPSGEHIEQPHDFVMNVTAPVPMDPDMMGMMDPSMEQPQGMDWKVIAGIVAGVIVVIIIITVVLKKRKAKAEAAFLAAEDEEDREDKDSASDKAIAQPPVDEKKGNDANEQL